MKSPLWCRTPPKSAAKVEMNPVEQIKDEVAKKDKSKFLTFLVFLIISTILWSLIKLTKEYTTQTTFTVSYSEVPVNKWISTPEQQVKLSFVANGFATLRHNLLGSHRRMVVIPLNEVSYRLEGGNTYSYGSQYVADRVADRLDISPNNVTMNDDKQFFNMEDLQMKDLPVHVPLHVIPQRQFSVYGEPSVTPASITVFGPKNVLDTMTAVYTRELAASNVSEAVEQDLPIDFYDGSIRAEVTTAHVVVDVVQYTEIDIQVPVKMPNTMNVRFFPETMNVKCMVPIKDYASLTSSAFLVYADTAQLRQLQPLLDIHLVRIPPYVQVLKTEPEQVEYLIIN